MQRTFGRSLISMVHRLVIGLVVLAVLAIPVECDASNGPHSVFLSPSEAGVSRDGGGMHDHRAPVRPNRSHHQMANDPSQCMTDDTGVVATDVDSQRGMSGFDVPFTINAPNETTVENASMRSLDLLVQNERAPAPLVIAPEPPPPR